MGEYRSRLAVWFAWSKQARPYAEELLSNEIYVYTSAIAMNALFSFAPFVVLMGTFAKKYFHGFGMDEMVYDILAAYLPFSNSPAPPNNRSDLEFILRNLRVTSSNFSEIHFLATLLLIWSVASVFIPLEMTMNRALGVTVSRGFWRSQWLAVKMVVLMGAITVVFIAGATATKNLIGLTPIGSVTTSVLPDRVSGALGTLAAFINIKLWMIPLTLIISCIVFYVAPNTKVAFRDAWPAAIVTGLLWELSNYIFLGAVPFLGFFELFGPMTIAITWMTWAYVGSMIMVLGANLMAKQVLTKQIERMKEALWNFKTESPS